MNYDEFVNEVQKYDSDADVAKLFRVLKDWKINGESVVQLQSTIERFFGHSCRRPIGLSILIFILSL
jgi:hypothetical protein